MSIFNRLAPHEIAEFEYEGLFCGVVPIYFNISGDDGESAVLNEKNFIPECALNIAACLFNIFAALSGYEGGFPITCVGKLKGTEPA